MYFPIGQPYNVFMTINDQTYLVNDFMAAIPHKGSLWAYCGNMYLIKNVLYVSRRPLLGSTVRNMSIYLQCALVSSGT